MNELVSRWSGEWMPRFEELRSACKKDPRTLLRSRFPRTKEGLLDLRGIPSGKFPSLDHRELHEADLSLSDPRAITGSRLVRVTFAETKAEQWAATSTVFEDCRFERLRLGNSWLGGHRLREQQPAYRRCSFTACRFEASRFVDAEVSGCRFTDCVLGGAHAPSCFQACDIVDTAFVRCRIIDLGVGSAGTTHRGGAISRCSFDGCEISSLHVQRGVQLGEITGDIVVVLHSLADLLAEIATLSPDRSSRATQKESRGALQEFAIKAKNIRAYAKSVARDGSQYAQFITDKAIFTRKGLPLPEPLAAQAWRLIEAWARRPAPVADVPTAEASPAKLPSPKPPTKRGARRKPAKRTTRVRKGR